MVQITKGFGNKCIYPSAKADGKGYCFDKKGIVVQRTILCRSIYE